MPPVRRDRDIDLDAHDPALVAVSNAQAALEAAVGHEQNVSFAVQAAQAATAGVGMPEVQVDPSIAGVGADLHHHLVHHDDSVDTGLDEGDEQLEGQKPRLKRTAITHEQRKALRNWFFSQDPRPSQADCIMWFNNTYGRLISQAAVSHSLHDRYKHLDFAAGAPSSTFRQRAAHWPELEAILFDYLQALEKKRGRSAFPKAVSGERLTKAAKEIWRQIPMNVDKQIPTFSNGWVSRFKGRYETRKQFGDAGAVDVKSLQSLAASYPEDCIYTMDETGLYWKRAPSASSIASDRSKVTLITCVNASGTDRRPLWCIGRHQDYHSLLGLNLSVLGAHWRSNENAWLTGSIMSEWLQEFYDYVGNQSVMLVLDNFSAHIQGLTEAPPPPNVRVQFLPTNSANFQPLEKGIIEQFKVYYRQHWLEYMVDCFNNGRDPLVEVSMRPALRWAVRAWDHDIDQDTIRFAFYEAAVLPSPTRQARQRGIVPLAGASGTANGSGSINMPPPFSAADILSPLYNELWQSHRVPDMVSMPDFINLAAEESIGIDDVPEEDVLQAVINYHLGLANDDVANDDMKLDDALSVEQAQQMLPSSDQILGYLQVIMHYLERQDFSTRDQMRAFEQTEIELKKRTQN